MILTGCSVMVARVLRENLVPVQIWTARNQTLKLNWMELKTQQSKQPKKSPKPWMFLLRI